MSKDLSQALQSARDNALRGAKSFLDAVVNQILAEHVEKCIGWAFEPSRHQKEAEAQLKHLPTTSLEQTKPSQTEGHKSMWAGFEFAKGSRDLGPGLLDSFFDNDLRNDPNLAMVILLGTFEEMPELWQAVVNRYALDDPDKHEKQRIKDLSKSDAEGDITSMAEIALENAVYFAMERRGLERRKILFRERVRDITPSDPVRRQIWDEIMKLALPSEEDPSQP